ncbi:MAG: PAS domain S-box protein [Planctomycetota bacterium]|jgi:PAS domain S-box-containing protein
MPESSSDNRRVEQVLWCLATVAEDVSEAVAVVDANGVVRFVNSAWARMHGYEGRSELVGKEICVFHGEEQMRSDVEGFMEEAKRRGQLAGPVGHVRKDGTSFSTETKMTVVHDKSGEGIGLAVFAKETSEEERGEGELRRCCAQLEGRVEQLKGELAAAREQLEKEISARKLSEEALLESIIEAEEPREVVSPLNPQEIKAVSELAKRLA